MIKLNKTSPALSNIWGKSKILLIFPSLKDPIRRENPPEINMQKKNLSKKLKPPENPPRSETPLDNLDKKTAETAAELAMLGTLIIAYKEVGRRGGLNKRIDALSYLIDFLVSFAIVHSGLEGSRGVSAVTA